MNETFKWRGGQVTRIEALTDAVFGFAITLLFVSFDIPQTFDAMLAQLSGFVAFAACFALITMVWYYHYKLFARFDMDDGWTIFLNSVLLFVVLFFVYPLKFTFSAMFDFMSNTGMGFSDPRSQVPLLMTIYAGGYIAVFLVFALMYHHAYRLQAKPDLSQEDQFYAYDHRATCLMMCAIGVLSLVIANTVPWELSGLLAGTSYALAGPAIWLLHEKWIKPRRARLGASQATAR